MLSQDDDYFVPTETIFSLHARVASGTAEQHPVYLLPPRDALSSYLRTVAGSRLHTSTAWLGYGSFIERSQAIAFIQLLQRLNLTEDEMRMADNYFAILRNQIPEVWIDTGTELGGGMPFTVGIEGDERNWLYTVRTAMNSASADTHFTLALPL